MRCAHRFLRSTLGKTFGFVADFEKKNIFTAFGMCSDSIPFTDLIFTVVRILLMCTGDPTVERDLPVAKSSRTIARHLPVCSNPCHQVKSHRLSFWCKIFAWRRFRFTVVENSFNRWNESSIVIPRYLYKRLRSLLSSSIKQIKNVWKIFTKNGTPHKRK
jgi:hypothetical protein